MKETWVTWYRILLLVFTVFSGISAFTFVGVVFYIFFNLISSLVNFSSSDLLLVLETFLSLVSGFASIFAFLGGFMVLRHRLIPGIRMLWTGVILYAVYMSATVLFAFISSGYAAVFAGYTVGNWIILAVSALFSIFFPIFFIYSCGRRDLIVYRPEKK